MEIFLTQYSIIPQKFINDFYAITKEDYNLDDKIIDFDVVVKWLDVQKNHLKRLLVEHFNEDFDYTIKKKTKAKPKGGTVYNEIFLTSDCFKHLCMISQTEKSKEVRKYFIEMENLVRKYYKIIDEEMKKKIGILKNNQKSKININSGVIYILLADETESLYKIGKSKDIKNRLKQYNSGKANQIEPLFIMPVNNIDDVEDCVKKAIKKYQYRKFKEVYEMNWEIIKKVARKCDNFINGLKSLIIKEEKNLKDVKKDISRLKKTSKQIFMIIEKN